MYLLFYEINYLLEIISVVFLFRAVFLTSFNITRVRIVVFSLLSVITGLLTYMIRDDSVNTLVIMLFAFLIPFSLRPYLKKQWCALFIPAFLFMTTMDVSNKFLLCLIRTDNSLYLPSTGGWYTVAKLMTISELLIIILLRRKFSRSDNEYQLKGLLVVNYYILAIALLFMMAETELFIGSIDHNRRLEIFTFATSSVVYYLIIWACIYQHHMKTVQLSQHEKIVRYEEYTTLQKKYLDNIIAQDNRLRSFRHDLNEHLMNISALSKKNDSEELHKYCDSLLERASLDNVMDFTGDTAIDAILSYMKVTAESRSISVNYHIQMPPECRVDSYDMSTILSNLLRNAIEACEKSDSKKGISLTMIDQNNTLIIMTQNPCDNAPTPINNGFVTTKDDSINHGFGMKNICESVEKYDGTISSQFENGIFTITICILL